MIQYFRTHRARPKRELFQQLDQDRISILSLRNKFKKDKFLSRNPACEAAISSELQLTPVPEVEKSKAASLVESRFLSSKTLSKEVDRVLQSFRALLGGGTVAGDAASPDNDDPEEWGGFGAGDSNTKSAATAAKKGKQIAKTRVAADEGSDGSDDEKVDGLQYSSNFEDEEGDADGWESGSVQGDGAQPEHASDDSDNSEKGSDDDEANASSLDADAPPKKPKKATTKQKPSAQESSNPASGSTFLPSLSVGFIPGDSDSEWSDGDADAGDLPKQKKNRRGQRARKA